MPDTHNRSPQGRPELDPAVVERAIEGRRLRLELSIRLRKVGVWPWLALFLWGLLARAQEPSIFRSDAIYLTHQALLFGGTILFGCLLAQRGGNAPDFRLTVILATWLAALPAIGQTAVAILLDLVFPEPAEIGVAIAAMLRQLLICLPVALVWVGSRAGDGLPLQALRLAVTLSALGLTVPAWTLAPLDFVGAILSLLVAAGSVAAIACQAAFAPRRGRIQGAG